MEQENNSKGEKKKEKIDTTQSNMEVDTLPPPAQPTEEKLTVRVIEDILKKLDWNERTPEDLFETLKSNAYTTKVAISKAEDKDFNEMNIPLAVRRELRDWAKPTVGLKAKTRRSNLGEGVYLDDPLISWRVETIKDILQKLRQQGVLLIRAPPFSGKTSFARLFEEHLSNTSGAESCHVLTLLGMPQQKDNEDTSFDQHFQTQLGMTWSEAIDKDHTIIVIDEMQKAYGSRAPSFWARLKNHMHRPENKGALVLLLAGYGEQQTLDGNTPIQFLAEDCIDMEEFRLTENEALEMLRNWNNSLRGKEVPISEDLFPQIVAQTGRHAGFFSRTIKSLFGAFSAKTYALDPQKVVEEMRFYLLSNKYTSVLEDTRAIPKRPLDESQERLLLKVIHKQDGLIPFPGEKEEKQVAVELVKIGFLVRNDIYLEFPSPIVRRIVIKMLISAPQPSLGPTDFEKFTIQTLSNMRVAQLKSSKSIGADGHLMEGQWQDEFYHAATSSLSNSYCMSPEVGAIFDIHGRIDFYVDGGLRWGYELLREGNRFQSHINRFLPNGIYYNLPLTKYAVIDFRENISNDMDIPDYTWIVHYAKDFSYFEVHRKGMDPMHLQLVG